MAILNCPPQQPTLNPTVLYLPRFSKTSIFAASDNSWSCPLPKESRTLQYQCEFIQWPIMHCNAASVTVIDYLPIINQKLINMSCSEFSMDLGWLYPISFQSTVCYYIPHSVAGICCHLSAHKSPSSLDLLVTIISIVPLIRKCGIMQEVENADMDSKFNNENRYDIEAFFVC